MHRKVGFPSPKGRGWPATALSPAVAGRVRGQLHGEDALQRCFAQTPKNRGLRQPAISKSSLRRAQT